jgi:3-phosphoshikimate 1-carboxyvinyltransferase
MDIRVYPSTFQGTVSLIGSKSLSHRYTILASLSDQPSQLRGLMDADDMDATKQCLLALGAHIQGTTVMGPLLHKDFISLDAHASGSTLRFLLPFSLLYSKKVEWHGSHRLPKRSLLAYQESLLEHGVTMVPLTKDQWLPLRVEGPLQPGHYQIKANVSSQFVSGLLMTLPFLNGDSTLTLLGEVSSLPYIHMTLAVLKDFGIIIEESFPNYFIRGNQRVKPVNVTIEGDYSHSVFFIAGALLGGQLTLNNLPEHSLQGDAEIVNILKTCSVHFKHHQGTIVIKTHTCLPLHLSMKNVPDLAPMLMALAGFINGTSEFIDIQRLNTKESPRLTVMTHILSQLNIPYVLNQDSLRISGIPFFSGQQVFETYDDHRIAMTLLMLAPKAKEPYIIKGVECIAKSFPNFLKVYQDIGGRFEIIGGSL